MDVLERIRAAEVTNSFVEEDNFGDKQIYLELTWRDIGITFKYVLEQFPYEGTLRIHFQHDYDCAGNICPLCDDDAENDCLELSEEMFEMLKEKLLRHNLKLMYVLK